MINPLDIAMTRVEHTIPLDVLRNGFKSKMAEAAYRITLNQAIETTVIRGRVLKDANLIAGQFKKIVLQLGWIVDTTPIGSAMMPNIQATLYRIPPEARDNMPLVDVSSVLHPGIMVGGQQIVTPASGTTMAAMGMAILNSHTNADASFRPTPVLLSGDIVKLIPFQYNPIEWVLECRVCHDNQFTSLSTTQADVLADWIVEAVKAYIYKELIVQLDRGFVEGGAELGAIKTIVESYQDSATRYLELKDKFQGAAVMSPERLDRILEFLL